MAYSIKYQKALAEHLFFAIRLEDLQGAEKLIKQHKADPNFVIEYSTDSLCGIAPIHYVAGMSNLTFKENLMKIILENGGDANVRTIDDETPLHAAVFAKHETIVQMLLDHGGQVDAVDNEGKTPITYAIEEGSVTLVRLFQKHVFNQKIEKRMNQKLIAKATPFLEIPNRCNETSVLTPNKMNFNYNSASPYLINVTVRKPKLQPVTIGTREAEKKLSRTISLDETENEVECVRVSKDLFKLTEENIERHLLKHSTKISRRSMIDSWREKVNNSVRLMSVESDLESLLTECETAPFSSESVETVINLNGRECKKKPRHKHNASQQFDTNELTQSDTSFATAVEDPETNFIKSPQTKAVICQTKEDYFHQDREKNIVFYEQKLLNDPTARQPFNTSVINLNDSYYDTETVSSNISIPLDYDTDVLREELTAMGAAPGPITKSTKRLYLKKLIRYQRQPEKLPLPTEREKLFQCYPIELYKTLRIENEDTWLDEISKYAWLEKQMVEGFKWATQSSLREGHLKTSFIYLLIDPLVSENLPGESQLISKHLTWQRFIPSIFYAGKAKGGRPFAHLYDAIKFYQLYGANIREAKKQKESSKLERIIKIWQAGKGVICLPIFHNILPAEAFTREAAIIECLGVNNLTNLKRGEYYGQALSYTMRQRRQLGLFLLHKAMKIFIQEGESQLRPDDVLK